MNRVARRTSSPRSEQFTATVPVLGREFTFRLYTRPLDLGPAGTVQYYWMDSSQFRNVRPGASAAAFRECVGHWWTSMLASGLGDDSEQQVHLVTALCYPLFCRDKSLQSVYRDAYLDPVRSPRSAAEPDDEARQRITRVIAPRDRVAVTAELDRVLGRFEPPFHVLPALQEAFRNWVGRGVAAMRRSGEDGLLEFLLDVKEWSDRLRKKGGQPLVRLFLNLFAYDAKVSFHRCYANVWIDLIPWLREHRGLDALSERFLRFWHNQNQPVAIPAGRTASGLYLPTSGGSALFLPKTGGGWIRQVIAWQSDPIGPTHLRDPLAGQVLSLHPLSGFLMNDPGLLAVAGRFFASDAHDRVMRTRRAADCPEYWYLIGAILSAAHSYRLVADELAARRGLSDRSGV